MPIVRTYACPECNYYLRVTLTAEQVDKPPPECPRCAAWDLDSPMAQDFQPTAIRGVAGQNRYRANTIAQEVARDDYGVADLISRGEGESAKVRYRDTVPADQRSSWSGNREVLEMAAAAGKGTRQKYGSGLYVIKTMPDLIEISKRRSARIW